MQEDQLQLQKAHHLVDLGRLNEARTVLFQLLAAEPGHTLAHGLLAHVFLQQREFAQCLKHLQTVFAEDPHNGWAHRMATLLWLHQGQLKKAEQHALQAVSITPDGVPEHINLSVVHLNFALHPPRWLPERQKRLRQAQFHAMKALELDPREPYAHNQAARVEFRRATLQPRHARTALERAHGHVLQGLALQPDHTELQVLLSEVLQAQEKWQASVRTVVGAVQNDPLSNHAHRQMDTLLEDLSLRCSKGAAVGLLAVSCLLATLIRDDGWTGLIPLTLASLWLGHELRLPLVALRIRQQAQALPSGFRVAHEQWRRSQKTHLLPALVLYVLLWLAYLFKPQTDTPESLHQTLYGVGKWGAHALVLLGVLWVGVQHFRLAYRHSRGGLLGVLWALWSTHFVMLMGGALNGLLIVLV